MYLDAGEVDKKVHRSFGCFCAAVLGSKLPLALSFPESHFTIKWFAYQKITETSYNIPSFPTQVKGFLGETSIFWVSNVTHSQLLVGVVLIFNQAGHHRRFVFGNEAGKLRSVGGLLILILSRHIHRLENIFIS